MKNPPHTYIQKLQSFLDPSVTRKVKCEAGRPHLAALYSPVVWSPLTWGGPSASAVGVGFLGSEAMRLEWLPDDREKAYHCPLVSFPFPFSTPFVGSVKLDWGLHQ